MKMKTNKQTKSGIAILKPNKRDFETKSKTGDKEGPSSYPLGYLS